MDRPAGSTAETDGPLAPAKYKAAPAATLITHIARIKCFIVTFHFMAGSPRSKASLPGVRHRLLSNNAESSLRKAHRFFASHSYGLSLQLWSFLSHLSLATRHLPHHV